MACISDNGVGQFDAKDESIQALASKLPEGDALPDGFSECFTEASGNDSPAVAFPKSLSTAQEGAFFSDESTGLMEINIESSRTSGVLLEEFPDSASVSFGVTSSLAGSQRFSSDSSDLSVELNDGSPCSSPSERRIDRREKPRRFPVQLSDKESTDPFNVESIKTVEEVDQRLESHDKVPESACEGSDLGNWSSANTSLSAKLHDTSLSTEHVSDSPGSQGTNLDNTSFVHTSGEQTREEIIRASKQDEDEKKPMLDEPEQCSSSVVQLRDSDILDKGNVSVTNGAVDVTLLEDELLKLRHKNEELNKEKKLTFAELAKSLLIREKLESLCRELQRQNKQLTDECKRVASEEQQKRLDLSTRFHNAIKDVTAKLEEQGDERLRQIKENEMLQEKLRHFTQQYEFREQQYAQQLRTKSLEHQLLEVKLKQQEEMFKQGEAKIQMYTEQIAQLLKTEQDLRGRLALYGDKFERFQDTLTKSNEVFASFKMEMEKMSKTIKKLEKENISLKKKCEKSDVSLIELVDERATLKKQLETTKNQKEKLEALCRSLQAERKQQNLTTASAAASAAATDPASSVTVALSSEQVALDQ